MDVSEILSTGEAAEILGMQTWRLVRLFNRGLAPEPRRFAGRRVIGRADIPAIREAAAKAGYLKCREAEPAMAG